MTIILQDTFTRANVASGWGTGTDGHTWVLDNTPTGTQSVSSNEGLITNSGTSTPADFIYGSSVTTAPTDVLVRFQFTNTNDECMVILRRQSVGNFYYLGKDQTTNGKQIKKRVSGAGTTLTSVAFTPSINVFYWLRARAVGSTLSMRMWLDGSSEPTTWDLTITDTTYTTAGSCGLHVGSSSTNTVSVDHFSVDDTKIPKDITARFLQRSANQLKDVVARFRQMSASQFKDISARFILSGGTTVLKDITSRFRQRSSDQLKDVAVRFRQRSSDQQRDITTRLGLALLRDIPTRFRQMSASQLKDVTTRLRQRSANQLKDVISRFRQMSANQSKDVTTRLRLALLRDVTTRLRLQSATQLKDVASRLRQMSAAMPKDITTRLRQRSANQLRDIASRLRQMSANQPKDISTRLVFGGQFQSVRDIASRLRQRSNDQLKDVVTRLRQMSLLQPKDISTRLRQMSTNQSKDISSRFRQLSALQLRDVTTRFRLSTGQLKDIASRLRLMSASQLKDVITRFRQRSANQLKDVRSRVRLSPPPDHILITVWENTDYTSVIGNTAQAPYLNGLISQGILFNNYHAIDHPSEGNYIAMFSGGDQGLTTDTCPQSTSAENVFHQLVTAGLTHKSYLEDLPSVGFTGCTNLNYVRRHNAAIQFTNVNANTSVPWTQFPTDYTTLPTLSVVIPNLQNDLHDGTMAQADSWLHTNLDGYIQWAKTHNSLFIFTIDESSTGLGSAQVPLIIVGQGVQPNTTSSQNKDHTNLSSTFDLLYSMPSLGPAPITGWYTPVTARVADIAARFVQRSANQLSDIAARFRLMSVSQLKDIRGRLRLMSAGQLKDVPGRLQLISASQRKDVTTRLRLALLRDITTRLRLRSANQQKDVTSRLRLALFRDVATRLRLRSASQLRDISTRLVLALATERIKDIITRLRLMSASQTKDVTTRLRQRSADQQRDVQARLRMKSVNQSRDVQTRLRQMSANQLKDIAARLKQVSAGQQRDVKSRFVLVVFGFRSRDISARFRLAQRQAGSYITVKAPRGKLTTTAPRGTITVEEE